jgi:uncharacterized damage-inducible protein DinB
MKANYYKLLQYEKWANRLIIDTIGRVKEPDSRWLDLMSHILNVQMVWYSRITKDIYPPPVWEVVTGIEEIKKKYSSNNIILDSFISELRDEDLNISIPYKTTEGVEHQNTLREILTHLFNHSTYHRGQIVILMKEKIPTLPATDFILFARGKW